MTELTKKKIAELEECIELHTVKWDSLGIRNYDQGCWPEVDEPNFSNCGCARHTFDVFHGKDWDSVFINKTFRIEYEYIYGIPGSIRKAAINLNIPVPTSFSRSDLVERCKLLSNKLSTEDNKK